MMSFNQIMRWSWAFLVAVTLSLGLAGCEGDDGAPGADGSDGANGLPGDPGADGLACWDLNGNGVGDADEDTNNDGVFDAADCQPAVAKVTPLESCAVCHDDGSIADAGAAHALNPIELVDNIVIAPVVGTDDLVVSFDLARDGVPTAGYDTIQRAYRTDGTTNTPFVDTVGTLTDFGDGSYSFIIPDGALVAGNNRYLFRVAIDADSESRVYFYQDYPASPFDGPVAVSAEACGACHGPEGIAVHTGGTSYFQAEDGGEPCLTCHGVFAFGADRASLGKAVHEYHSGIWEGGNEITYPTYMNNCSVCHNEAATLAAVNAAEVSGGFCFTCHGSMEGLGFAATDPIHGGLDETSDCGVCHGNPSVPTAPATVAAMHNGSITERDGVIWDGVDTSVTEGAKIDWWITGVADDGTDLSITWEASYDGIAFSPCNADPAAGPVFFADADDTVDPPVDNGDNLSILRNYAQGEDFILGTRTDRPQPGPTPGVSADNTTCDSGGVGLVATTVVPVEATDAMYGRVAIQGKPRVLNVDPTPDPDFAEEYGTTMPVRAKTPTYDWEIGTSDPAPERRAVVDTGQCLQCHVGSLYQHGGNRVDNVDMCYLCHNPAANDQYVRVGYGVDASEAYDGRAGQAFGIKEMVHAVHPAGATGNPVVIYRGRGIYAWADSVDKLSNWPEGDWPGDISGLPIFGSDDGEGNPRTQTHHFHIPTYPRGLSDCAACHVSGLDLFPDATKAMATTVESGAPPFAVNNNDVLQGAQTTSCVTCHADSASKGHAYQNSWTPQVFPEGRQTIIDAN